jgi:acetate kinase
VKILVVNAGSTSYKCRLFDMDTETELAHGGVERVGGKSAAVSYGTPGALHVDKLAASVTSHGDAVRLMNSYLCSRSTGVVADLAEIAAVGFKTIQAGDKNGSVLLSSDVLEEMERYAPLAPAHNPPYLDCIRYFRDILPGTPLVGVFEPGFHTEIPEYARVFGTPYEWYKRFGVRKYGYHGASFRYVTDYVVNTMNRSRESVRIIACHLGGSSSVCAYKNGRSIDVSMTFSPQSGLLQSSRTGDIDPFVLPYIMERKKITLGAALDELGTNGGLKGLSGVSGDMRDVLAAADAGNGRAALAIDKFVYDVVRYIGSFHAVMEGVDIIAFSGGIGFESARIRKMIVDRVAFLGIDLDPDENEKRRDGPKTRRGSTIAVVAVDTNEEIVVARETKRVIGTVCQEPSLKQ